MAQQSLPWPALKAGIFILTALIILAVAITLVGQKGGVFSSAYTLTTEFEQVAGLKTAAPVWLAGVEVGSVTAVRFRESEGRPVVQVSMRIQQQYQPLIRGDSVATIDGKGLLGDKLITIAVGSQQAPMLEDGDELRSEAPMDFNALVSSGATMLEDLSALVSNVRNVTRSIDDGEGSLGRFVKDGALYDNLNVVAGDLAEFARKVNSGDGLIARMANDDTLYNDVAALLAAMQDGKGTLSKLLNDPVLYDEMRSTAERADSAMAKVNDVISKLEGNDGSAGLLLNDAELHQSVNETLQEFQLLMEDFQANPRKYIKLSIF